MGCKGCKGCTILCLQCGIKLLPTLISRCLQVFIFGVVQKDFDNPGVKRLLF